MISFTAFFRLVKSMASLLVVCGLVLGDGRVSVRAQSTPDAKPDVAPKPKEPEPKSKEPELKKTEPSAKEAETKPKDPEPTTKELEHKLKELEQKVKELDPRTKEADAKPKESDQKTKEPEKPREADAKPKEGTKTKEPDTKPKEAESKPKEAEIQPKEPEVAEQPCPQVHIAADGKPAANGQQAAERQPAEKPKPADSEGKKPMRSPMVTAKLALMADSRLFPYDIEVDTKDNDLVLLGKVGNDIEKRAATDIVRCLDGVHAVENRLKVEADASHGLVAERDKIITNLVKERFEKSKTLQAVKFDVKTEGGIVTLTGSTRFQVIILEAAQAARQVPGVKAVNTDAVRLVAAD
jgi:hyperosmotically inducible protein